MLYGCVHPLSLKSISRGNNLGKWPISSAAFSPYLYYGKEEQRKASCALANGHEDEGTHPIVT
jgi:hypothetical protein